MDSTQFKISQFDPSSMVPQPSICIIAKRGRGKSFLIKDLLYQLNIPCGTIISPGDRMNSFYKYFFPDSYINYDLTDELLKNVLLRQSIMIENKRSGSDIDPSATLVMDDCLSKKCWCNNENMLAILMNGRHYKLTYIISMQTPLGITPDIRLNFDYVFLLREDSMINKKKLWDNYASVFPTFASFEKVFNKCTENYSCLVIDNKKPCDDLQNKIFWYKARDLNDTQMLGCPEFIDMHKKIYKMDWHTKFLHKVPIYNTQQTKFVLDMNMYNLFVNKDKISSNISIKSVDYVTINLCKNQFGENIASESKKDIDFDSEVEFESEKDMDKSEVDPDFYSDSEPEVDSKPESKICELVSSESKKDIDFDSEVEFESEKDMDKSEVDPDFYSDSEPEVDSQPESKIYELVSSQSSEQLMLSYQNSSVKFTVTIYDVDNKNLMEKIYNCINEIKSVSK